jgi:hypothetical protein
LIITNKMIMKPNSLPLVCMLSSFTALYELTRIRNREYQGQLHYVFS